MTTTSPTTAAARADLQVALASPRVGATERAHKLENPGFGSLFSEHMVTIPYCEGAWQRGRLEPFAPLSLSPATVVLHYGQAIFEGFKAYRQPDGAVCTFRPHENALRFNRSAERLAMPDFPVDRFIDAVDALIDADRDWVPAGRGRSLYLRPLMIATDAVLGVRPALSYLFCVMGSPSASYFQGGLKPVTVWISEEFVRAAPGGTGFAKCAGNYAASLLVQRDAAAQGCDQVVWLDAIRRCEVEEMGGMNIMFVFGGGDRAELVTPPLTGTILPGVTRASILTLARTLGYATAERTITVAEWRRAAQDGALTEAFACGTAATVTPIGHVKARDGAWTMGDGTAGSVTQRIRTALLDVQYGTAPDAHGWMHTVIASR
jgi:branched-chain amino acid aminotransferase